MKLRVYSDVKVNIKTEDILKSNVIYKLTFPSGKVYIGQTCNCFETRLRNHISVSFNRKSDQFNSAKSRAIRKYMTFSVEILYEGDDLDKQEIYYIEKYNATDNKIGYNLCVGGVANKGYKHTEETKKKLSEIAKKRTPETLQKMSEAQKGKPRAHQNKPIVQYDKQGNFIKEWPSTKEASIQLGIASTSICSTCKGKLKTSGGFIWKYKNN